jgi:hypothetical protein
MRSLHRIAVCLAAAGCAHARTPDAYRADTGTALATKASDITACYNRVLAKTPTAAGHVTVTFAVEENTGRIADPKLDSSLTTAPDDLSQCVLAAIPALSITPADPKRGQATWSWDFATPTTAP